MRLGAELQIAKSQFSAFEIQLIYTINLFSRNVTSTMLEF